MKIPTSFKRAFCSQTTAITLAMACLTGSLALPINSASAEEAANRKVRVGLFTMPGYQEKDSSGNYIGYGYDFLQSIKLYNNWDYEYVEYGGSYGAALKGLEKGEVDIVTSTTKNAERLLKYNFSSKPIGNSSTILTIKQGQTRFEAGNYATYNGMRVGLLVGNSRNDSFAAFAKENGFTYEPIYFKSVEAVTKALQKGLIDAQISSDIRRHVGEDVLDVFDNKDFYLITRIEDKKLIEEANSAINQLYHVNPNWIEKLTEKYYEVQPDGSVSLSKQEKAYIAAHNKAKQKLKVLFYPDHKPFSYYQDGEFHGETVTLFKSLAKKIGMEYEIIPAHNIEQFNQVMKNQEADIIPGLVSSNTAAEKLGYILTDAYLTSNQALLININSKQARRIAVNKNAAPQVQYAKERYSQGMSIVDCNTNEECVRAVKEGKADICLTNILEANMALMKDYKHVLEAQSLHTKINIAIGISNNRDRMLASIISKGINSYTKEELDHFMLQSMTELKKEQNLESMMHENPLMLAGFVALGLGIVGALILGRRRKQHLRVVEEKNQALQQAYDESEAQLEEIKSLNDQLQDDQTLLEENVAEQEAQLEEIGLLNKQLNLNQAHLARLTTEQYGRIQELEDARNVLIQLQQEMRSGIWQLHYDAAGNFIKVTFSKEYREILSLGDENFFSSTVEAFLERVHPEDREQCLGRYETAIADKTGQTTYDCLYRFRNGADKYRWIRSVGNIVRHSDGTSSMLGFSVDETDEINRDYVTGGLDREGFLDFMEDYFHNATTKVGYSLLYINVRSFKALNELWGFAEGDKFIKYYYNRLVNSALKPIKAGRRGDHFFCLVKWDDSCFDEIEKLCNIDYTVDNSLIVMRLRCGIYHLNDEEIKPAGLLDRAKLAKENITDLYVKPYAVFDEKMQRRYVDMAFAAAEVHTAIADNQFKVYYQPIVEAQSGKLVSAEALVRWQHPQRGLISPGIFIPVFEKEGLITAVDRSVFAQVSDFYNRRLQDKAPLVPVSVNFSWMDFYDKKLMESLLEDLATTNYPEGLLRAEITESSYAALSQNIGELLEAFRARRVKLLLDDFGTGVSSLDMLQRYSFDILKIDMSFTKTLGSNPKTNSLLQAVIDMCHQMGIDVIAEGVETIEQLDFYRENNCDYIQGYYFYKPMPEEEFIDLLEEQAKHGCLVDFRKPKDLLPSSYYKAYLYFPNEEMRKTATLAPESILQMIGDNSGVGTVSGLYDENYSICFFSNLTAEFLGYTNEELLEKSAGSYLNLVAPDDRERFCKDESMERYYSLIDSNGHKCYVKELRTNIRNTKGESQWLASLKKLDPLSDEEMLRIARMSEELDRDSFTHLLTKNAFFRKMDLILQQQPELPCTLMVMDLDNFKIVNDICGHMRGDEVLLKVVDILTRVFRGNDLLGRFGGDEFMVLMRGTNDKELAKKRAAQIIEIVAKEIYCSELHRPCTISIGVVCSEGASVRRELFEKADAALYKAKYEGRNTFRLSE